MPSAEPFDDSKIATVEEITADSTLLNPRDVADVYLLRVLEWISDSARDGRSSSAAELLALCKIAEGFGGWQELDRAPAQFETTLANLLFERERSGQRLADKDLNVLCQNSAMVEVAMEMYFATFLNDHVHLMTPTQRAIATDVLSRSNPAASSPSAE